MRKHLFCNNSEASTSEILKHIEEMFPWYCVDIDVDNIFKYSTTQLCVTRHDSVT